MKESSYKEKNNIVWKHKYICYYLYKHTKFILGKIWGKSEGKSDYTLLFGFMICNSNQKLSRDFGKPYIDNNGDLLQA